MGVSARRVRPGLRVRLAVLAALLLSARAAAQDSAASVHQERSGPAETRVRVGVYDFPPLVAVVPQGGARGLYVDLLEHVAQAEGWTLEYVPGTWEECVRRLGAAEIDLLPVMGYSAERARYFAFNDEFPVLDWAVVFTPRRSDIRNVLDLRDRRIAVVRGSIYTAGLRSLLVQFAVSATLVEKPDYREVFRALEACEVDAGINGQLSGAHVARDHDVEATQIFFSPVKLHYATLKGSNEGLLRALDAHFAALKATPDSLWYDLFALWVDPRRPRSTIPSWLLPAGLATAALLLLALAFLVALRRQVASRTAALVAAHAELAEAQKLEAVGRLAGGIAHDFNNLLTPILVSVELLREGLPERDERRELVDEVEGAAVRAKDLVRQLLAFGRKQALQARAVDVNAVVRSLEELVRRTLREDIALHVVLAPSLPAVVADVSQMEQVLMNLVVNAQDAMPSGGTIVVETRELQVDESYAARHPQLRPGAYVMLAVSDTGHGMDAPTLDRIFDPFFTTKPQGKGSGLGLATVHGIVRQHGGHVWVYSEPGKGATFKVCLPVAPPGVDVAPAQPPPDAHDLRGHETVMVVEDNDAVRVLAVRILERLGYRVLSARSGDDCLRLLARHDGPLELVLTDVIMPDMNGRALFERIRPRFPAARVLYMSGYTENVIVHHGVLDEGIHFVQKPFTTTSLGAKVRAALA